MLFLYLSAGLVAVGAIIVAITDIKVNNCADTSVDMAFGLIAVVMVIVGGSSFLYTICARSELKTMKTEYAVLQQEAQKYAADPSLIKNGYEKMKLEEAIYENNKYFDKIQNNMNIRGMLVKDISRDIAQYPPIILEPTSEPSTQPCKNCGYAMDDDYKYCPNCGAQLGE